MCLSGWGHFRGKGSDGDLDSEKLYKTVRHQVI